MPLLRAYDPFKLKVSQVAVMTTRVARVEHI